MEDFDIVTELVRFLTSIEGSAPGYNLFTELAKILNNETAAFQLAEGTVEDRAQ